MLEKFIRPNVPLIDGLLLGGGIGITLYGTHCIAGENFRMAMPQVGIGFLPDIGGTYFLSRLPNRIGTYLALTGRSMSRADAHWCRLVSHCIPATHFPVIKDAIADNHPIDRLLDGLHKDPGEGELAKLIPTIDRIFAADFCRRNSRRPRCRARRANGLGARHGSGDAEEIPDLAKGCLPPDANRPLA